jgi:hypothetical protein
MLARRCGAPRSERYDMSDQSQGPGWWVASDGKWYPPQPSTGEQPAATGYGAPPPGAPGGPTGQPSSGSSSTGLLLGIGALVVLLLLGGLAFALTRSKNDTVATPPQASTTAPAATGSSTTTSASKTSTTEGGDTSTTAKGKTSTTKASSNGPANFPPPKDPAGAIQDAGLPELTEEGSIVHYHAHLDVIVNGEAVTVASQIGIAKTTISPMHTHDKSGVVHIEADEDAEFTTRQFFTEWAVALDKDCVGDFCADDDHQLLGFVNGEQVDDPSAIVFTRHDEVVIWYGSSSDSADIPSSYDFPEGL